VGGGVDVTTFSIAMINYMSGGKLQVYVDGLEALLGLEEGEKVLIGRFVPVCVCVYIVCVCAFFVEV
jgi:hypothetical protein